MDIKIPAVGESITEATISEWLKQDGEYVTQNEVLLSLETDKASVEVVAEKSGILKITTPENETVKIGAIVGNLDTQAPAPSQDSDNKLTSPSPSPSPSPSSSQPSHLSSKKVPPSSPEPKPSSQERGSSTNSSTNSSQRFSPFISEKLTPSSPFSHQTSISSIPQKISPMAQTLGPATRRIINEYGLNPENIPGTGPGGRITKTDALNMKPTPSPSPPPSPPTFSSSPNTSPISAIDLPRRSLSSFPSRRKKMTSIRKKIAQRLVQAQHTAAILTTFNEVDMTEVIALRAQYKETFEKRYGLRLGFMGFFVKAVVAALKDFPAVNGRIEGDEIVYNDFVNMGIAVGGPKGLVVPVIRNADLLNIAEIEMEIKKLANQAQSNKLSIEDLSGGTFTISNGGVYGSLMSTPILNPPQSAILGMHKIEERPVAVKGQVEIRPMMYLAMSYDHRIIDGKESVSCLVRIKEGIEDPRRLLLEL